MRLLPIVRPSSNSVPGGCRTSVLGGAPRSDPLPDQEEQGARKASRPRRGAHSSSSLERRHRRLLKTKGQNWAAACLAEHCGAVSLTTRLASAAPSSRPGPPYLSATTTGCATSKTSAPPSPTARCASASTWTVVAAGPAPASDTVFLYGVP